MIKINAPKWTKNQSWKVKVVQFEQKQQMNTSRI